MAKIHYVSINSNNQTTLENYNNDGAKNEYGIAIGVDSKAKEGNL